MVIILTNNANSHYNYLSNTTMFLSLDLMIDIFVRLPVKSLIRFKSVCIHWNSFISSLEFAKAHQRHAIANNKDDNSSLNVFFSRPRNRLYSFSIELVKVEQMNLTCKLKPSQYPIGSSNGLICLLSGLGSNDYSLNVLNPLIQEQCLIKGPRSLTRESKALYWGFGYDPLSDDYKIAFLGNAGDHSTLYVAYVFTLRTNQWRQIECPSSHEFDAFMSNKILETDPCSLPVHVGHTLYWQVNDTHDRSYILAFDLVTDSFEIIRLPTNSQSSDDEDQCRRSHFFICQLRQRLCACWVWIESLGTRPKTQERLRVEVSTMERCGEDDIVWKLTFKFKRFISCLPGGGPIIPKLFELKQQDTYLIIYSELMACYVIDPKTTEDHVISPVHVKDFNKYDNLGNHIMREVYTFDDYTQTLVSPTRHLTPCIESQGRGVKNRRLSCRSNSRTPMKKMRLMQT